MEIWYRVFISYEEKFIDGKLHVRYIENDATDDNWSEWEQITDLDILYQLLKEERRENKQYREERSKLRTALRNFIN